MLLLFVFMVVIFLFVLLVRLLFLVRNTHAIVTVPGGLGLIIGLRVSVSMSLLNHARDIHVVASVSLALVARLAWWWGLYCRLEELFDLGVGMVLPRLVVFAKEDDHDFELALAPLFNPIGNDRRGRKSDLVVAKRVINDDARLVVVFAAHQHDLCLGLGCLLSLDLALALPLAQPITVEVGLGGVGLRG